MLPGHSTIALYYTYVQCTFDKTWNFHQYKTNIWTIFRISGNYFPYKDYLTSILITIKSFIFPLGFILKVYMSYTLAMRPHTSDLHSKNKSQSCNLMAKRWCGGHIWKGNSNELICRPQGWGWENLAGSGQTNQSKIIQSAVTFGRIFPFVRHEVQHQSKIFRDRIKMKVVFTIAIVFLHNKCTNTECF